MLSLAGAAGFAMAYIMTGSTQIQGISLALALMGLALAFLIGGTHLVHQTQITEDRVLSSSAAERRDATAALEGGIGDLRRRPFLLRLCGAAIGALGLTALLPLRSLGPNPNPALFHTKWRPGARLVRSDGTPIHRSTLKTGDVLTVFPEGFTDDASSQTILLRLPPGTMRENPARGDWTPDGYTAFSKVCTHAGCPVGLYRRSSQQLLCPCHQSVFSIAQAAQPIFGPATRALPQLPLRIGADGYLRARSDFHEPVGPGFWERGA